VRGVLLRVILGLNLAHALLVLTLVGQKEKRGQQRKKDQKDSE